MKPTATRVTSLAVLAVLISVAAVHAGGSEAARAKRGMTSSRGWGSIPGAVALVVETAGATAPQDLQLLPNGDFEQGQQVWTVFSQNGWEIIMDSGFPGPVVPHAGSWLAWLGGDDDEVSYVEQEVTVPEATTGLSFWYWLASYDACGSDFGWLKVDGAIVEQYDLCTASDTGGWELHEVDFSAYAGQTVTVRFQADTDGSDNSNFFLDDVSLEILGIFADGFESGDTSAWSGIVQ